MLSFVAAAGSFFGSVHKRPLHSPSGLMLSLAPSRIHFWRSGLYLDAIAFDRTTMERIRKKMEKKNDSIRLDIHRSGGWCCHGPGHGSPALRYMQHFAWTDSLWMGEGFDCECHRSASCPHAHPPCHVAVHSFLLLLPTLTQLTGVRRTAPR